MARTRIRHLRFHNHATGFALVITLGAVVLLTVLVLAFYSRAQLNRQIAFTSANLAKTDQFGHSSLNLIVGEIQKEIADPNNSTSFSVFGRTIYQPKLASNMMPEKSGVSNPDAAGRITLAKVSGDGAAFFTGGSLEGSNIGIDEKSLNERYITTSRWFGSGGPYLGSQGVLPTWIFQTRANGVTTPAISGAKDPASADYVIGRFAYTVYDISGLLDIGIAGHPSAWNVSQIDAARGTLAAADLSVLGIDSDALIAWRNARSRNDYSGYVTGFLSETGGLRAAAGDATFLGRSDLIKAASSGKAGLTLDSLNHLTTFSRSLNEPDWSPFSPVGSSIDYAANANETSTLNRFVANVRFSSGGSIIGYDQDGLPYTYSVVAGDPLIQHRFPLSRLNWIGLNGPQNGGNANNIRACFGLRWDAGAGAWQYTGSTGAAIQSQIKTLAEVAQELREPNFFELLQAGILSGSLGVAGGGNQAFPDFSQQFPAFQIFRIGAALVDQYDEDSYPTVIEYEQSGAIWQACGIESLPYVNVFKSLTGNNPNHVATPTRTSAVSIYNVFGLWNPNQTPNPSVPPNIRIRVKGGIGVFNNWAQGTGAGYSLYSSSTVYGYGYVTSIDASIDLKNSPGTGAQGFTNPGLLTAADITGNALTDPGQTGRGWTETPAAASSTSLLAPNKQYLAYRIPDFYLNGNLNPIYVPGNWNSPSFNDRYAWVAIRVGYGVGGIPFQYSLEFQNNSGTWIPYSFSTGNNDPITWQTERETPWLTNLSVPPQASTVPPISQTYDKTPLYLTSDPRSVRFGPWAFSRNVSTAPDALITSLWPTASEVQDATLASNGYGGSSNTNGPLAASRFQPIFGTDFFYPAHLSRNNTQNTSPTSSYVDRDNVRRIADSGLYTSGSVNGNPFQNAKDRPIILNRPFRTVAEIGYAFRDDPWKSLDLFSANSADAGLLDLFSVETEAAAVSAGSINLNSQDPLVIQALLENSQPDVMMPASTIGKPSELAQALTDFTKSAPLRNKSELATLAGPALPASVFSDTDEEKIKSRRETFIRALSDVGQTRTWNLLVDLVAQTGRYPQNAASLADFNVHGERRYWMHVAVDRFTGNVIDYQIESVIDD